MVNVGKYTIHGSYGRGIFRDPRSNLAFWGGFAVISNYTYQVIQAVTDKVPQLEVTFTTFPKGHFFTIPKKGNKELPGTVFFCWWVRNTFLVLKGCLLYVFDFKMRRSVWKDIYQTKTWWDLFLWNKTLGFGMFGLKDSILYLGHFFEGYVSG